MGVCPLPRGAGGPKFKVLKYTTKYMHLGSQVPVLLEHKRSSYIKCMSTSGIGEVLIPQAPHGGVYSLVWWQYLGVSWGGEGCLGFLMDQRWQVPCIHTQTVKMVQNSPLQAVCIHWCRRRGIGLVGMYVPTAEIIV
jgi:hypothetical protein